MKRRAGLAVVASFVMACGLAGQRTPRPGFWVAVGAGPAFLKTSADFGVDLAISYRRGPHLFTLRNAAAVSILGAIFDAFGGSDGPNEASDVALLYGRAKGDGAIFAAVSAGIGYAEVSRDTAGTTRVTHHFTLPLEGQVAWHPAPFLGLAITGFASLNGGQSFGGLTFGVQVGKLR